MVYLIHFDKPLKHARHYLGSTRLAIEERLKRHGTEHGAKILLALKQKGIGYQVVRTWTTGNQKKDRLLEKLFKKWARNVNLCPICNIRAWERGEVNAKILQRISKMQSHKSGHDNLQGSDLLRREGEPKTTSE